MQLTQAQLDAALGNLIATGATFDPAALYLGVGTAIVQAGLQTQLSAITQATGAMATRQSIASWSSVYHLQNGCSAVDAPVKRFAPASSSEAQILACWFLASALTMGNLLAYGLITPNVSLTDASTEWAIVLRLCLDPRGQWSAEVTFNG